MSDVEKRIEQWRVDLAGSELLSHSDVNELESHLRDEMEHLQTSGLSDEETFLVARRRLGDMAALEEEFAKLNAPRRLTNRLWWMVAGVLAYLVAAHFSGVASQVSLAITQQMDLGPRVLATIATAVRIAAFCAVGTLVLWLCIRCAQAGSCSCIHLSRRVRLALLLGVLIETLAFAAVRAFGVVHMAGTMSVQDYGQMVMLESFGSAAWRLMGPVLLAVLLITMHFAARQRPQTP
jgi:hypothetical protein